VLPPPPHTRNTTYMRPEELSLMQAWGTCSKGSSLRITTVKKPILLRWRRAFLFSPYVLTLPDPRYWRASSHSGVHQDRYLRGSSRACSQALQRTFGAPGRTYQQPAAQPQYRAWNSGFFLLRYKASCRSSFLLILCSFFQYSSYSASKGALYGSHGASRWASKTPSRGGFRTPRPVSVDSHTHAEHVPEPTHILFEPPP